MNEQAGEDARSNLSRLVMGFADQRNREGIQFWYDGGELYPDEVADFALAPMLGLAQGLAQELGMDIGCEVRFCEAPNPVFPLAVSWHVEPAFHGIAPYVYHVMRHDLLECRSDLAQLFERAAQRIHPGFTLTTHTAYVAALKGIAADGLPPSMGHELSEGHA
jgi:hypothetical protein